jgi:hypothetical protein
MRAGAPLCPVGKCDSHCLCREEVLRNLNLLLTIDVAAEFREEQEKAALNKQTEKEEL